MSMHSYVQGIKPPDEKFNQMLTIWKACIDANVNPPAAVHEFFRGDVPDEKGVIVDLQDGHPAVREYKVDMQDGFEIDLRKLPEDIKIIRFVNSY
jgi:hypothetical protein